MVTYTWVKRITVSFVEILIQADLMLIGKFCRYFWAYGERLLFLNTKAKKPTEEATHKLHVKSGVPKCEWGYLNSLHYTYTHVHCLTLTLMSTGLNVINTNYAQ